MPPSRTARGDASAAALAAPKHRERPKIGQWVLAAVVLYFTAGLAHSLYTNDNLEIAVIRQYMFDPLILRGVLVTLQLTAISFAVGLLLGLVVAFMRLSSNKVLFTIASVYIWFFRSIPPLVQIIFWAFLAALYPRLGLGLPFTGVSFFSLETNAIMQPFIAAVVALTLIEAAYCAEVIRAGIQSVNPGQRAAGRALALREGAIMARIILPQAMPAVIPPMGNNLINLLKGTSLVSVIGGSELMTQTQYVYSQTFQVIPLLTVASIWYLILTGILTIIQSFIERHYTRGNRALRMTVETDAGL